MKKRLLLALSICMLTVAAHAQFARTVTFEHYFTKDQIDSVLNAQGLPHGILTTQYDVKVYKVIYNTVGADSLPTTASGLMVVPQGVPCDVPMLSYQHNNVFKKTDVPTRYRNEWFVGLAAASMGLVTVMPDGLGLGDGPGFHPFLHLQSEATSVIDLIRAARETVDSTGTSYNSQLFLAGIAEGAFASVAAHQYIQTYMEPAIHVTGTGAIAGYYDLSGTMVNTILSNSPNSDPSFLPALFQSYNKVYHYAASDSDIFVAPYDSLVPILYNGSTEYYQINTQLPTVPNQVLQPSIVDTLADDSNNFFTQLLRKNDAYNWSPQSRLDMFFCTADEVVPYQHSGAAYGHFVANGSVSTDTLNVGATYDHELCGQFSVLIAVNIIKQLIFQPIIATVTASGTTSAAMPDGTAYVTDSLGDPPYRFLWSTGDTTSSITGLAAGTYYVTVTDQSHCSTVDSAVVRLLTGVSDLSMTDINVYPNPTQGQIVIDYKNSTDKIESIELLDVDGDLISTPTVIGAASTRLDLSANAKGIYMLHIRTQSGRDLRRKVALL